MRISELIKCIFSKQKIGNKRVLRIFGMQFSYTKKEKNTLCTKQEWQISAQKNLEQFKESSMVANLSENSLCIDCGANIGSVTGVIASTGAIVHAFEPHPLAFAVLKNKFANKKNVILHQQAVLDKVDTLQLFMYNVKDDDPLFWSQGASLYKGKNNVCAAESVTVQVIDLIEFIYSLGRDIDILKLDIEGGEYDVLIKLIKTGLYKKITHILVETHDRKIPEVAHKGDMLRRMIKDNSITNIDLGWV